MKLGRSKEEFLQINGPHIATATHVVVLMTDALTSSPFIFHEVLFADWLGKKIVTAMFKNVWTNMRYSLKAVLGECPAVDFETKMYAESLDVLEHHIKPLRRVPGVVLEQTYLNKMADGLKPLEMPGFYTDPVHQSEEDPKVFISYQWDMQSKVDEIRALLERSGFACWADIAMSQQRGHSSRSSRSSATFTGQVDSASDTLQGQIQRSMRHASVVLCCITPKYLQSDNCIKDLSLAETFNKPIVPLLLRFTPFESAPSQFETRQFEDTATTKDTEYRCYNKKLVYIVKMPAFTEDKENADLWLLNSCTVKSPAEDHFRNDITQAQKSGKRLVLAGCVPQGQPNAQYMQGLSVVGVQQIDRVVEVVEETLKGHTVRLFGQKKQSGKKTGGAALNLPKIRKNPLIEIIAINTGCLNQCTYCKTKHARGDLGSYPPEDIVERAKQSFSEGVVEIWLTSEDLGAYGHDIGVTLPELLWQLEMAKILNHPRVYSFLHVPVQSASDSVLMDMRREYCCADFKHVVDFLRERVPDVNIATDIICGFPTETEKDFEETLELVRQYKFASLFINQFFPRPELASVYQVLVPKDEDLMGKMVEVEIVETGKHFMKGRIT
nr:hypothetical protein BaRGS_010917 [Batillaria attramentaria]